ncbi:MAG: membrane protein insertase YidC [Bacteroidetes bacterium]|nr:membrane protein insertase YidC [Bacteroidota bacterium]
MNFDKNTTIGFVLLMALLFGYIFVTNKQQAALMVEKHKQDSIAKIAQLKQSKKSQPIVADSTPLIKKDSTPVSVWNNNTTPEQLQVIETELLKITFTNKGGYPKSIELKKHKGHNGQPVILGEKNHLLSYPVLNDKNETVSTADVVFTLQPSAASNDSFQYVSYVMQDPSGKKIEHRYQIPQHDYMIDWSIRIEKVNSLVAGQSLNLRWNITTGQQERDLKYEKGQSNIGFFENNAYDFNAAGTGDSKELGSQTKWIGVKQQFFNTTLIAPNEFSKVQTEWAVPGEEADSLHEVMKVNSTLSFNTGGASEITIPLKMYYGPNDFKALQKYELGLENHVQLGYGIFAFVKYINRMMVMPVFNFLHNNIGSLGIVILLLTFFIRLIISPLTYTSYLSGAKMKVLRPEIDELKKKYGDDQQTFSMEQMKLFRQAGVNPLGGCIPALLQIPIFFALYSFFNATLSLRGESFLWSHDLSGYDSIATLPFSIPWYGDHVSLFTITATLTSLLISVYNTQMTPQQDNPVFKYMIYIFPLMLLFIFNSLPSALTWYYTVSNLVTLLLQLIIQKFIINEAKIHAKIQENRKKPVTQSKWQQKLEQMQQTNQKLQEMKKKGK